jgi:hypothetical protein
MSVTIKITRVNLPDPQGGLIRNLILQSATSRLPDSRSVIVKCGQGEYISSL